MAFSLIPKNDAYFEDFREAMEVVGQMARRLGEGLATDSVPPTLGPDLKHLDTNLHRVVRRCLDRLDASFVTPIEREDIHELILAIGDVGEALEVTASRFDVYAVESGDPALRGMVAKVSEMTRILVDAIASLRTLDPALIRGSTARVRDLENEVDVLYREALRALFLRRPEAVDLVRWKDLYDGAEDAADNGRHVARTIDRILVRHS